MVSRLVNARGNAVKNQYVITDEKREVTSFQSYNSVICEVVKNPGMGYNTLIRFGRDWDYSPTTAKHRNKFLSDIGLNCLASKKDIEDALKRGHARLDESIAVLYDETL